MVTRGERAARHENTRFLMIVEGGKRVWMTFEQCARSLNSLSTYVEDGALAIDVGPLGTGLERSLTEMEKSDIDSYADDWAGMA